MTKINSSPDWFARSIGLVAICLTIVSLYFTNRTYTWQKKVYKEGLDEKVLVRFGFKTIDNKGDIGIEVVNIGMHPIYIKSVEIQVPNGCKVMNMHHTSEIWDDECWIPIYNHEPNEQFKPLEPGEAANYAKKWDYAKSPILDWIREANAQNRMWVGVTTTKKSFRQHPVFSWAYIGETIEHLRREIEAESKKK